MEQSNRKIYIPDHDYLASNPKQTPLSASTDELAKHNESTGLEGSSIAQMLPLLQSYSSPVEQIDLMLTAHVSIS